MAKEEVDQLDKASVMRLAIAYLKVRDMVDIGRLFLVHLFVLHTVLKAVERDFFKLKFTCAYYLVIFRFYFSFH